MDPWFTQQAAGIIGGVLGATLGGVLGGAVGGGVCGPLAAVGKARRFVMGYFTFLAVLGTALVLVGAFAVAIGQPWYVWYCLGLPGVIVAGLAVGLRPVLRKQYAAAEQRRIDAASLRAG
jgi:hypothetical protein